MKNVLLDQHLTYLNDEKYFELLKEYDKILLVGENIKATSFDENCANYCIDNNCDFLTSDKKSYDHFFKIKKVSSVEIFQFLKKEPMIDRPVYCMKINLKSMTTQSNSITNELLNTDKIKNGRIQFDCRLLNPNTSYDMPFDKNEKEFIEHGDLNEKELLYIKKFDEYNKIINQKKIEESKSKIQIENEINKWLEDIRKKDLTKILENYTSKYGIGLSRDSNKLNQILKKYGIDTNFPHMREALITVNQKLQYDDFLKQILSNAPTTEKEYIENFLGIYGEHYQKQIPSLKKIFSEKGYSISNLLNQIDSVKNKVSLEQFESSLRISHSLTISDCDKMNGFKFEKIVGELFHKQGYLVQHTKGSGDQGADLIIEKFGKKKIVQCKRSEQKISNKAVQEIVSAIKHYNANSGVVVTNNLFHRSAIDLAESNNVELIDREILEKWIKGTPIEKDSLQKNETKNDSYHDENDLPLLNDEIFMKVIQELEGNERKPIPIRLLIKNLMNTGKFTETSSKSMMWDMVPKKIYEPSQGYINSLTPEIKLELSKKEEEEKRLRANRDSKMSIFMQILIKLQGSSKNPIHQDVFVKTLVKTGYFTEPDSLNYIRRMLREASIYESKPNHYNTV